MGKDDIIKLIHLAISILLGVIAKAIIDHTLLDSVRISLANNVTVLSILDIGELLLFILAIYHLLKLAFKD
jgi:hypothetical protein